MRDKPCCFKEVQGFDHIVQKWTVQVNLWLQRKHKHWTKDVCNWHQYRGNMTYTGLPPELRLSLYFLLPLWKLPPEFINMLWDHRCYHNNKTIRLIKRSLSSQSATCRRFLLWNYLVDVDSWGQPPLQQIMKTWTTGNNMNVWTTCGSQSEALSFWWN